MALSKPSRSRLDISTRQIVLPEFRPLAGERSFKNHPVKKKFWGPSHAWNGGNAFFAASKQQHVGHLECAPILNLSCRLWGKI